MLRGRGFRSHEGAGWFGGPSEPRAEGCGPAGRARGAAGVRHPGGALSLPPSAWWLSRSLPPSPPGRRWPPSAALPKAQPGPTAISQRLSQRPRGEQLTEAAGVPFTPRPGARGREEAQNQHGGGEWSVKGCPPHYGLGHYPPKCLPYIDSCEAWKRGVAQPPRRLRTASRYRKSCGGGAGMRR